MQKKIENLEFVQGVNFEYIDSLKNNGTKPLLIFDVSCEELCNSKAFVDVMEVTRLDTQLGLDSELVGWSRDATSVPFGHLLIGLSPRTDNRVRFCTNSGSTPSYFCIAQRLKHLSTLEDEHTEPFCPPSVPITSPQTQKLLSSVLPKRV